MLKPRSEVWQEMYGKSRYLSLLSREALTERLRWSFENILTLDHQGKIGAEFPKDDQERLWIAFTHTWQEFQMRGENPPDQFLANAKVPRPSYPLPPPELMVYQRRKRPDPGQSFKFGRKEYLEDVVTSGKIELHAASSYKDPSLNYAVADDELHFTLQPKLSDLRLIAADGSVITATINNATFALAYPSDFYVYCMTGQFGLRLFKDFEYDSCLIVYDMVEFVRRFRSAFEARSPDWIFMQSYVSYVDPNNPGPQPPIIPISKHLRFVYQREFRLIFHPRTPIPPKLANADIYLEPCGDIAEVISLE